METFLISVLPASHSLVSHFQKQKWPSTPFPNQVTLTLCRGLVKENVLFASLSSRANHQPEKEWGWAQAKQLKWKRGGSLYTYRDVHPVCKHTRDLGTLRTPDFKTSQSTLPISHPQRCQFHWDLSGGLQEQRASLMAQTVKNLPAMQETRVQPLGCEDFLEKERVTNSSILAWRLP